ncbi:MAG: T9SS type A sorting domain-containing protein [Bacteroidetes bacterium]|nr:T9SS type A sorting domain-containing protein [Bacteroidota bacterium]
MKKAAFLLLNILFCTFVQATHNRGGSITYKHIAGLTYEVTVITYTKAISSDSLEISWGDGSLKLIPRTKIDTLLYDIKQNTYKDLHTYSSPSTYKISVENPNRIAGIKNIQNSINTPFYIESELYVPSNNDYNNSVEFSALYIAFANQGRKFTFNISAFDEDKDLLSFELISCKGSGGADINGYWLPNGVSIDSVNGEILWDSPQQTGMYNFAIKISECRNNKIVGSVTVDFQIIVFSSPSNLQFLGLSSWPTDSTGTYIQFLNPNDSIQLILTAEDSIIPDSIHLLAYGEPFMSGNNATFQTDSIWPSGIRKVFKWTPNNTHLRCSPYIITFKGNSFLTDTANTTVLEQYITLIIFVSDSSLTGCDTSCSDPPLSSNNYIEIEKAIIQIAPNPVSFHSTVRILSNKTLENFTFSLYTIWGNRVVYIPNCYGNQFVLDRYNLPPGIYFYRIESKTDLLSIGKLVVQ